jgi:hypothetical protein
MIDALAQARASIVVPSRFDTNQYSAAPEYLRNKIECTGFEDCTEPSAPIESRIQQPQMQTWHFFATVHERRHWPVARARDNA